MHNTVGKLDAHLELLPRIERLLGREDDGAAALALYRCLSTVGGYGAGCRTLRQVDRDGGVVNGEIAVGVDRLPEQLVAAFIVAQAALDGVAEDKGVGSVRGVGKVPLDDKVPFVCGGLESIVTAVARLILPAALPHLYAGDVLQAVHRDVAVAKVELSTGKDDLLYLLDDKITVGQDGNVHVKAFPIEGLALSVDYSAQGQRHCQSQQQNPMRSSHNTHSLRRCTVWLL